MPPSLPSMMPLPLGGGGASRALSRSSTSNLRQRRHLRGSSHLSSDNVGSRAVFCMEAAPLSASNAARRSGNALVPAAPADRRLPTPPPPIPPFLNKGSAELHQLNQNIGG
jgi:hypothetical protein